MYNPFTQLQTPAASGPAQRQTSRPEGPGVVKLTSNRFQSVWVEHYIDTNAHRGTEALADTVKRISEADRATLLSVEVDGVSFTPDQLVAAKKLADLRIA